MRWQENMLYVLTQGPTGWALGLAHRRFQACGPFLPFGSVDSARRTPIVPWLWCKGSMFSGWHVILVENWAIFPERERPFALSHGVAGMSVLSPGTSGPGRGTPPWLSAWTAAREDVSAQGPSLAREGLPSPVLAPSKVHWGHLQAPDWFIGEDLPSGYACHLHSAPTLPPFSHWGSFENQDQIMALTSSFNGFWNNIGSHSTRPQSTVVQSLLLPCLLHILRTSL